MEHADIKKNVRDRLRCVGWIVIISCLSSGALLAQGWTFTFTVTSSGPCGAYMPTIPTFTVPYMPSRMSCESVRQQILNIRVSQPMYDDKGNYIGDCAVFYTATSCSGADIPTASGGDFAVGSVSIDGLMQGSSFFSPHQTQELENWMNDFQTRLRTMGIALDPSGLEDARNIPLTGDIDFDAFYMNQALDFSKPHVAATPAAGRIPVPEPTPAPAVASEVTGSTVQLLTSSGEQRERDDWMTKQGFNDLHQIGENNTLDARGEEPAEKSWGEAAIREYVGDNVAGSFALKVLDGTTKGISEVVGKLGRGDTGGAAEQAASLDRNVVRSAAVETGKEQITGLVTNVITAPALGLVKGAGTVASLIGFGVNTYNTKHGK